MIVVAPRLRLIVCGTADRGDDGAALRAVAHLLPRLEPPIQRAIEIRRRPQLDPMDLIDVPPNEACLVLDTVVGVPAGSVVTRSLCDLKEVGDGLTPRSSHALPIDQVVGIAEAVRGRLPDGGFVGIGGKWFGFGELLSRAVRSRLPDLESAIELEVLRLLAPIPA